MLACHHLHSRLASSLPVPHSEATAALPPPSPPAASPLFHLYIPTHHTAHLLVVAAINARAIAPSRSSTPRRKLSARSRARFGRRAQLVMGWAGPGLKPGAWAGLSWAGASRKPGPSPTSRLGLGRAGLGLKPGLALEFLHGGSAVCKSS